MFKLWRGVLNKGYYEVQLADEVVKCWYAGDTLYSITDDRQWVIEDNVFIRPIDLTDRTEDEEKEAKAYITKLAMTQSIAALVEKKLALSESKDEPKTV